MPKGKSHEGSSCHVNRPTPIWVAFKGALNNIKPLTMMGHAIQHAVECAGVDAEPGLLRRIAGSGANWVEGWGIGSGGFAARTSGG